MFNNCGQRQKQQLCQHLSQLLQLLSGCIPFCLLVEVMPTDDDRWEDDFPDMPEPEPEDDCSVSEKLPDVTDEELAELERQALQTTD